MYRFKEQFRDAKVCIPSLRLVVTADNVSQYAELIFKSHKDMLELVEEVEKVEKVKKVAKEPVSSPPSKLDD